MVRRTDFCRMGLPNEVEVEDEDGNNLLRVIEERSDRILALRSTDIDPGKTEPPIHSSEAVARVTGVSGWGEALATDLDKKIGIAASFYRDREQKKVVDILTKEFAGEPPYLQRPLDQFLYYLFFSAHRSETVGGPQFSFSKFDWERERKHAEKVLNVSGRGVGFSTSFSLPTLDDLDLRPSDDESTARWEKLQDAREAKKVY